MSCDISSGRARQCRDQIGGNSTLYLFNYVEDPFTYANGAATAINASLTTVYEFPLFGDNNTLTQTQTPDRNAGTTVNEQELVVELPKLDAVTSAQFDLLTYGYAQAVVKDRQGNYHALGILDGMDWTVEALTGGAKSGDFVGYRLTGTAETKELAPLLDAATVTAFLLLVA